MKLVMTIVVRDGADLVEAQIAYHLNAGVDFVIASEHGSQGDVAEILESYARDGHLLRLAVEGEPQDDALRTRLARTPCVRAWRGSRCRSRVPTG